MKKIVLSLLLIIILYIIIGSFFSENSVIPDESIRLRVIANSNTDRDQQIKVKVKNVIQKDTSNLLSNTKGIESARKKIKENLKEIKNDINKILEQEQYNLDYKINYGQNYFPTKEYKGIKYDSGYYESLVVTLGEGNGHNWWCVLFPPLCLLEVEEGENVEYKSIVNEVIKKYL